MQDNEKLSILANILAQIKSEARKRQDRLITARVNREELNIACALLRTHPIFTALAAIFLLSVFVAVVIILVEDW